MIIAIDGPAAAGKGTLARRLGRHFNLAYLDTGRLYRAVGFRTLQLGFDPNNADAAAVVARALDPRDLDEPGLRDEAVGAAASVVAAHEGVRKALLDFQRDFAHRPPKGFAGAVLDGRDIGTVVCPEADVKLFVTARPEVRAERRVRELQARGVAAIHSRVLQDMNERDARDIARGVAPLSAAVDAFVLDTSEFVEDAAFAAALAFTVPRNPVSAA